MKRSFVLLFASLCLCVAEAAVPVKTFESWQYPLERGRALQAEGRLADAIPAFQEAMQKAKGAPNEAAIALELGTALLQANRSAEAEGPLLVAYGAMAGEDRSRIAIELGNIYFAQRRNDLAARYYRDAIESSRIDSPVWFSASLNLARTRPAERRLELLSALRPRIDAQPSPADMALLINVGTQALTLGKEGYALAYESLERAHTLAATRKNLRYQIEALEGLSHLYETAKRWPEVASLTSQGMALVDENSVAGHEPVLIQIEWRRGRAYQALGQQDQALASYHRAVEMTKSIRQDLPIEFYDGQSSYKALLEPLFHGYVELLLNSLTQDSGREQLVLGQVRDAIEFLHQSEMQDFLGDRCAVEEAESSGRIELRTAILYPILLTDRVELLVETSQGLTHYKVAVPGQRMRDAARQFASMLRSGDEAYAGLANTLSDALIKPVKPLLAAQQIETLVIVPDGELRLVPFAALRDEKGFLIEQFAVAAVTGVSMTNLNMGPARTPRALLAGVALPGAVVEKVASDEVLRNATATRSQPGGKLATNRSLRFAAAVSFAHTPNDASGMERAKKALALPGVKEEIKAIGAMMPGGTQLLDESFTVGRFRNEGEAGDYRIVHIASHGVFGGSAETSYVLAHDDLLTINRLKSVLQSDVAQRPPVELLALSACETAEGNDRAPLGIAGAAIRARAKSVLGTLWPVDDDAARIAMESFYSGVVTRKSKAASLQHAQLKLLNNPAYAHPFFWAPFSLIGNWR